MNQNQNAQCCNLTDEDRMQDMLFLDHRIPRFCLRPLARSCARCWMKILTIAPPTSRWCSIR